MVLRMLACVSTVTTHLRFVPTPAAVLHSKFVFAVTTLQETEYFVPLAPPYVADTQPLLQVGPKFVPTTPTVSLPNEVPAVANATPLLLVTDKIVGAAYLVNTLVNGPAD